MNSLKGKVVIITGASGGIGETTAAHLAGYGCNLVLTARGTQKLEDVAKICRDVAKDSIQVLVVTADLSIDADIENVVKATIDKFGRIDVLVNNAAILAQLKTIDTPMKTFDDVMRTNIRAPFYLSKLCLPHLIESKGNIVNVSSISGQGAYIPEAAYCISKAALDHFTKILAMEAAENKVRVNSVNPGCVRTDMEKKAGMSDEEFKKYEEEQNLCHPLGGIAEPLQVAKAIAFFASDEADFTTGQLLFVDGGRNVKPV